MNVLKRAAMFAVGMAAFGLFFTGCTDSGDPVGSGSEPNNNSGVSFQSFSPRSIMVENRTGKRLVAFKKSLNPSNLISGIPEYAINHGLRRDGIFTETEAFPLVIITEEDYNTYKSNIGAAPIFAELFAFYNHGGDNNIAFVISSAVGGQGKILLDNNTKWNIEIRRNSPKGEVLGYVAGQSRNTTLKLEVTKPQGDDYDLYPVFKRYNAKDKEIYTVEPVFSMNSINELERGKSYWRPFIVDDKVVERWDLSALADGQVFSLSSGGYYIRVENQSDIALDFMIGSTPQNTSTGESRIRSGQTNTYSVPVGKINDTYPDTTKNVSTLKISNVPIPTHSYRTDYTYTIRVTGRDFANLLIDPNIIESDNKVDFDSIFND